MIRNGEAKEAARERLAEGLFPVPVAQGGKGVKIDGWVDKTFAPEDFPSGVNIGLHHINSACVDRDTPEAYEARRYGFLPYTRMDGRESAPESHSWYKVEGEPKSLRLKDRNGQMLVELRCGRGHQTLIPPSIHPSGEPYVSANPDTPMVSITAEKLERGARLEAAMAFIARNYPPHGGQYEFGLHLAGFLLRGGLDADTVYTLMLGGWEIHSGEDASKQDVKNIHGVVYGTADRLESGEEVTGGPRLDEEYGEFWTKRLGKILAFSKEEEERITSARWVPIDIASALDGELPEPKILVPNVLREGAAHSIYGPGGIGKSWVMIYQLVHLIRSGKRVLLVDLENGLRITVDRLKNGFNITGAEARDKLQYFAFPPMGLSEEVVEAFVNAVDAFNPDLVAFDSWVRCLSSCGLDENSATDVDLWADSYVQPVRSRGIASQIIDHTPKEGGSQRGSGRKYDFLDVQHELKTDAPFSRHHRGAVKLWRRKDREGVFPDWVAYEIGGSPFYFAPVGADGEEYAPILPETTRNLLQVLHEIGGEARYAEWFKAAEAAGILVGKNKYNYHRDKLVEGGFVRLVDGWYHYLGVNESPAKLRLVEKTNLEPTSPTSEDPANGGGRLVGSSLPKGRNPTNQTHAHTPTEETKGEQVINNTGAYALDIETHNGAGSGSLNPRTGHIGALAVFEPGGEAPYILRAREDIEALLDRVADEDLIFHNAAFDLAFLRERYGFVPEGRVMDTMILSQLAYAGEPGMRHSLKDCLKRELGVPISKEERLTDWGAETLTPEQIAYAKGDVLHLPALVEKLYGKIHSSDEVIDMELALLPLMADMFRRGIAVDVEGWHKATEEVQGIANYLEHELDRYGAEAERLLDPEASDEWAYTSTKDNGSFYNWGSTKDVQLVAAVHGIDLPSTGDEILARFNHPFTELLREHRKYSKLVSSFGEEWISKYVDSDGVVRANWKQAGTVTGRFACGAPNLQQLPREGGYRELLRPRPGNTFIHADYDQIELRITAVVAKEPKLKRAYEAGKDVHSLTAKSILGKDEITEEDRQMAKALNFGLIYGLGAKRLKDYAKTSYGVDLTETEAEAYRNRWFQQYPLIRKWHSATGRELDNNPTPTVETFTGRRRVGEIRYTEALNTPVQGAGADGLKKALLKLHLDYPEIEPVILLHDEIVAEVPADRAEDLAEILGIVMEEEMSEVVNRGGFKIPIKADPVVSDTWSKG